MALFNKLFSKRRTLEKHTEIGVKFSPEFTEDQLRIVIYRDSDARGLRVLFDSSSVERVPLSNASRATGPAPASTSRCRSNTDVADRNGERPSSRTSSCSEKKCDKKSEFVEITDGCGYRYLPPKPDIKKLAEMAFGSVAMSFQGCACKIHYVTNGGRKMFVSLVFPAPPKRKKNWDWQHSSFSDASFDGSSCHSSFSSFGELHEAQTTSATPQGALSSAYPWCQFFVDPLNNTASNNRRAVSVGPPSLASNASLESECAGGGGGGSSGTSLNNMNVGSWNGDGLLPGYVRPRYLARATASAGSLSRRPTQDSFSDGGNEREETQSRHSSSSLAPNPTTAGQNCGAAPAKLALGLLIDLGSDFPARERLEWFILVHLRSLETLMWRLKTTLEMVYSHQRAPFVHTMFQAVAEFKQSVVDLYVIPRLSRPLWTVFSISGEDGWSDFAKEFVSEFLAVLERYDSKETNFFVSTMLTAVLTHHLGWTAPFLKELSDADVGTKLAIGGSPIQCQMDDISGLLGFPPRSARTLVVGIDATVLARFVSVLSFFVRFNTLKERTFAPDDDSVRFSLVSSTPSATPSPNLTPCPSVLERRLIGATWSQETLLAVPAMTPSPSSAESACGSSHSPSPCLSAYSLLTSPKLKRTRSFATKLSDRLYPDLSRLKVEEEEASEDGSGNASLSVVKCHRKTRSADLTPRTRTIVTKGTFLDSSLVPDQGRNGIEIVHDEPRRTKKVEFVLGQNEKLELTPRRPRPSDSEPKRELVEKIHANVPVIRIETVAPVGRSREICSAVEEHEVLEVAKEEDEKCSWSRTRARGKREVPKVSVYRKKEKPSDSVITKLLRRASDPVSPSRIVVYGEKTSTDATSTTVSAVGRCARFMSLQWNGSLETRESLVTCNKMSPSPPSRLYPFLFEEGNEGDGDLLEIVAEEEEAVDLAFQEIFCPGVTSIGVNSDPSWAPARTMFAGVGPRFVSGVAVSGVLFPPASLAPPKDASVSVESSSCDVRRFRASSSPSPSSSSSSIRSNSSSSHAAATSGSSSGITSDQSMSSLSSGSASSLSSHAFQRLLHTDLSASVKSESSILAPAEIQPEAVCIIGDTIKWSVETVNNSRSGHWSFGSTAGHLVVTSPTVASMLETVVGLAKAKVDHLTCLMFLENSLREIFLRSFALRDYLMNDTSLCDIRLLCEKLDLEVNDVPLLMSVASTHSPEIMRMFPSCWAEVRSALLEGLLLYLESM